MRNKTKQKIYVRKIFVKKGSVRRLSISGSWEKFIFIVSILSAKLKVISESILRDIYAKFSRL